MSRLAALLRRLAERIDPSTARGRGGGVLDEAARQNRPTALDVSECEQAPEYAALPRRERQEALLQEIKYLIERNRDHDPDSGLLWFERWQLRLIMHLFENELELRERQFAKVLDDGRGAA